MDYKDINISKASKIWIYRANQTLSTDENRICKYQLDTFIGQWQSHGNQLVAYCDILYNQFVVIMIDESIASASGCSIDKSVHFLEDLGRFMKIDFFDTGSIHILNNNSVVKYDSLVIFKDAILKGEIDENTMVFDQTVLTKEDFDSRWIAPVKSTWMKRLLPINPSY
jgi:hypothetical protein